MPSFLHEFYKLLFVLAKSSVPFAVRYVAFSLELIEQLAAC